MNPHKILGVEPGTNADDIKKAYKSLAKKYHPDANGGDDTKFKEISHAYEILTNPKARAQYESEQFKKTANPFGGMGGMDFGDIFRGFSQGSNGFSQGPGGFRFTYGDTKRKIHGKDIQVRIFITLEEVFNGKTIEMEIQRNERINSEKREVRSRKIKLNIPKGVENGKVLHLRGEGHQGLNGGRDGNVNIIIQTKPHDYFWKKKDGLYTQVEVFFTQAILGATVEFLNLNSEIVELVIPPGTQPGDIIELRGEGMPFTGSDTRGYLKVIVKVKLPTQLESYQKENLRIFQEQFNIKPIVSSVKIK